jgi:hypothetical protein
VAEPIRPAYQDNPEVARERTDVDTRAIIRFGATVVVILIATYLVLLGLLAYFNVRETRFGRGPGRMLQPQQLPPEPRLEVSPRANLEELRAAEKNILENYGWIDKGKGVGRIPIERAMEIIAQRGLPAREQARGSKDDGKLTKQQ